MFKKFTALAFTGAMLFSFSAEPVKTSGQDLQRGTAIHLQNGRLYLNGELIHKGFSLVQARFAYLYFYVPERGLFTISNHEFGGAMQQGAFTER